MADEASNSRPELTDRTEEKAYDMTYGPEEQEENYLPAHPLTEAARRLLRARSHEHSLLADSILSMGRFRGDLDSDRMSPAQLHLVRGLQEMFLKLMAPNIPSTL